jgi:hypothetical protein
MEVGRQPPYSFGGAQTGGASAINLKAMQGRGIRQHQDTAKSSLSGRSLSRGLHPRRSTRPMQIVDGRFKIEPVIR